MATIKKHRYNARQFGGFTPYGNVTSLKYDMATDSTGAVIDSSSTSAVASGDVIDLGPMPAGMSLEDASLIIRTGMSASVTGSLGFVYEDGVDSTEVPQDAAYFMSSKSLASAARHRADTGKLVVLPKPARLILTTGGAANAKVSDIVAVVTGELTGPR